MKRLLTAIQRETGLAASETVVVLTVLAILLVGWLGSALAPRSDTHNVVATQKVIALLDSLLQTTGETSRHDTSTWSYNRAYPAAPRTAERSVQTPAHSPVGNNDGMKVNINTASSSVLQRLPGVGPATAQKIIEERRMRPFTNIEDIQRVKGIGPKKYEKLRPFITAP